ncbi:hypothetical protein SOMG_00654 [Schizosaccharomyces osmophilus]|uniref:Uncharacterized protein n=1 Tax=Schizosaccharomyces osmophilus TaxID=2545709 RepID=A0AAF0AU99_9SCHI|nr:uncharacterized protein SOMG_00654 [Schizosaccharomyces osmophilus]WBW70609.1 hypothetical protein SOMG_00654 [Schizosaccharomyces osmophilus]
MEENTAQLKLYWNDNESIVADVLLNVNTGNDKLPVPVLNLNNKTWDLLNFLEMKDDTNNQPKNPASSVLKKEVSTKTPLTTSKPRIPLKSLTDEENSISPNIQEPDVATPPKQFREQPIIGDENAFSSPTKGYRSGNRQECEYIDESSETLDLQGWFTVENELDQTFTTQQECENISETCSEFDELSLNFENVDSCLLSSRRDSFSFLLENGSFTTLSMTSNDMISTSSMKDDMLVSSHEKTFDLEKDKESDSFDNCSELHLQETNEVDISNGDEASNETSILSHPTESFTLENDCLYYNPQLSDPNETNSELFRKSQPTKIWLMLKAKAFFDEMEQSYRAPLNFFIPTFRVELNLVIHSSIHLDWNAHVSSGHFDTQLEQSLDVSNGSSFCSSAPLSASSLSNVVWYTKESLKSVKISETTVSVSLQEDESSFKHLQYEIQCICASKITENSTFTVIAPEAFVLKDVVSDCLDIEFEQQRNDDELDIVFTKVHQRHDMTSIDALHALQILMMDPDAVTENHILPIPIVKHMKHSTKVAFEELVSDYQVFLYDIHGNSQTLAMGCCEFTYNKDMNYGFTLSQLNQCSRATVQNPFIRTRIKRNCLSPIFKVFDGFEDYLQLVFSCILILDSEDQTDILKLKLPEQSRLTWVIEGSHNYLTNVYYSDGIYSITNSKMKQSLSLRIGMLVPLQKTKEGMVFRLPAVLDYTLNHVVVDMEGLKYKISAIEVDKRIHLKPLQRLEFKLLRNVSVLFILREETVKKKRAANVSHTEADSELKPEVSSNLFKETLAVCSIVGYLFIFYQIYMKQI